MAVFSILDAANESDAHLSPVVRDPSESFVLVCKGFQHEQVTKSRVNYEERFQTRHPYHLLVLVSPSYRIIRYVKLVTCTRVIYSGV